MCAFSEAGAKSLSLAIQFIETMLTYCRQSDSLMACARRAIANSVFSRSRSSRLAMLLEQFPEEALTEPLRQLEAAIDTPSLVVSFKTAFRLNRSRDRRRSQT